MVNALHAADCMDHFTGKDQNAQEALKSALLEEDNGTLRESLMLVHHRRPSVAEEDSPASRGTLRYYHHSTKLLMFLNSECPWKADTS